MAKRDLSQYRPFFRRFPWLIKPTVVLLIPFFPLVAAGCLIVEHRHEVKRAWKILIEELKK